MLSNFSLADVLFVVLSIHGFCSFALSSCLSGLQLDFKE